MSLSDATVLTFFSPICTAISGAMFLGESFKLREATAGCKRFSLLTIEIPHPSRPCILVVSFAGVVLIARPATIFGGHGLNATPLDVDEVATSDRMKAVM